MFSSDLNDVESLVSYINEVKPFRTKLTQVSIDYQFDDKVSVGIADTEHFFDTVMSSAWNNKSKHGRWRMYGIADGSAKYKKWRLPASPKAKSSFTIDKRPPYNVLGSNAEDRFIASTGNTVSVPASLRSFQTVDGVAVDATIMLTFSFNEDVVALANFHVYEGQAEVNPIFCSRGYPESGTGSIVVLTLKKRFVVLPTDQIYTQAFSGYSIFDQNAVKNWIIENKIDTEAFSFTRVSYNPFLNKLPIASNHTYQLGVVDAISETPAVNIIARSFIPDLVQNLSSSSEIYDGFDENPLDEINYDTLTDFDSSGDFKAYFEFRVRLQFDADIDSVDGLAIYNSSGQLMIDGTDYIVVDSRTIDVPFTQTKSISGQKYPRILEYIDTYSNAILNQAGVMQVVENEFIALADFYVSGFSNRSYRIRYHEAIAVTVNGVEKTQFGDDPDFVISKDKSVLSFLPGKEPRFNDDIVFEYFNFDRFYIKYNDAYVDYTFVYNNQSLSFKKLPFEIEIDESCKVFDVYADGEHYGTLSTVVDSVGGDYFVFEFDKTPDPSDRIEFQVEQYGSTNSWVQTTFDERIKIIDSFKFKDTAKIIFDDAHTVGRPLAASDIVLHDAVSMGTKIPFAKYIRVRLGFGVDVFRLYDYPFYTRRLIVPGGTETLPADYVDFEMIESIKDSVSVLVDDELKFDLEVLFEDVVNDQMFDDLREAIAIFNTENLNAEVAERNKFLSDYIRKNFSENVYSVFEDFVRKSLVIKERDFVTNYFIESSVKDIVDRIYESVSTKVDEGLFDRIEVSETQPLTTILVDKNQIEMAIDRIDQASTSIVDFDSMQVKNTALDQIIQHEEVSGFKFGGFDTSPIGTEPYSTATAPSSGDQVGGAAHSQVVDDLIISVVDKTSNQETIMATGVLGTDGRYVQGYGVDRLTITHPFGIDPITMSVEKLLGDGSVVPMSQDLYSIQYQSGAVTITFAERTQVVVAINRS